MDLKAMVPGMPTLPSLIYDRRDEYVRALRAVDKSLRDAIALQEKLPEEQRQSDPQADLSVMSTYLRDLVLQQMASAVAALSGQP